MNDDHMHDMGGMAPSPPIIRQLRNDDDEYDLILGQKCRCSLLRLARHATGMYILVLVFVFVMGFVIEWLPHNHLIEPSASNVPAEIIQTLMHAIRFGLVYMVMLAVMSFNGGVFLAAVASQSLGFLLFGARLFEKKPNLTL